MGYFCLFHFLSFFAIIYEFDKLWKFMPHTYLYSLVFLGSTFIKYFVISLNFYETKIFSVELSNL